MRSSAARALSGEVAGGAVSTVCLPRALEGVREAFSGIVTTVQRGGSLSFLDASNVNTCVPSSCSGFRMLHCGSSQFGAHRVCFQLAGARGVTVLKPLVFGKDLRA